MPDLSLAKAKFFTMNHFFPPVFFSMEMKETGLVMAANCLTKHRKVFRAAAYDGSDFSPTFFPDFLRRSLKKEGREGAMGISSFL